MITDYKNKMLSPELKQVKFNKSSPAIQAVIKARYQQHRAAAFKVGAKPMEWREFLDKEGY